MVKPALAQSQWSRFQFTPNQEFEMAKREESDLYRDVAGWLEAYPQWAGTYGELASCVGRPPKENSRAVGTVVKTYKKRQPGFDDHRVFRKSTGRPGYEP